MRGKLCQSLHLLRAHSILNEWPAWIFYLKLTIQFHLHFNGEMCQTSRGSAHGQAWLGESGAFVAGEIYLALQKLSQQKNVKAYKMDISEAMQDTWKKTQNFFSISQI